MTRTAPHCAVFLQRLLYVERNEPGFGLANLRVGALLFVLFGYGAGAEDLYTHVEKLFLRNIGLRVNGLDRFARLLFDRGTTDRQRAEQQRYESYPTHRERRSLTRAAVYSRYSSQSLSRNAGFALVLGSFAQLPRDDIVIGAVRNVGWCVTAVAAPAPVTA